MKTNTVQRTAEFSADAPLHNVQLAATPQRCQVLSSGIYTHKALAVVRELVSNAWDAHNDASNESIPIVVHLPTALEPWFSVHDYGPGLPPEAVVELYMNYGRSDKQHTNSLIGGFGLGSKAPFALTDQFTVTSRYNGTKYTFQAFLNSDGAPVCTQLGAGPTDEPNGLTVYVPVEGGSLDFERALRHVGKYMSPKPVVEGQPSFDFRDRDYEYEINLGDGIVAKFFLKDGRPRSLVVQGIVPYATGIIPNSQNHDFCLELHCPIGTFEPTVSRERIAMNGETHGRLQVLIDTAYERLHEELTKRLYNATTWYEWVVLNYRLGGIDRTGATLPAAYTDDPYVEQLTLFTESIEAFNLSPLSSYTVNHRRQERCERMRRLGRLGNEVSTRFRLIPVPRRNAPTRRMATKYFENQLARSTNRLVFVHGTMHDLTRWADHYGIPHECLEHPPELPTQPAATRKRMGATKYEAVRIGPGHARTFKTADQLVDDFLENDDVLILTHKNDMRIHRCAEEYRSLVQSGDLPDPGSLVIVEINNGHSKVTKFLANEHQGETWEPSDIDFQRSTKITDAKRREIADRWTLFHELPNSTTARHYRRNIEALLPDTNRAPSLQHLINMLEDYIQFTTSTTVPSIPSEILRKHSSGTPEGPAVDLRRKQDAVADAVAASEPFVLRDLFATELIGNGGQLPFVLHPQPTGRFPRRIFQDGFKEFVTYINQLLLEDRA